MSILQEVESKTLTGYPNFNLVLVFNQPEDGVATYKKRWKIQNDIPCHEIFGLQHRGYPPA